jgi:hypothetical protein
VRIEILPEAREDLIAGYRFYESQAPGLGSYFSDSPLADVDLLITTLVFTPGSLDTIAA